MNGAPTRVPKERYRSPAYAAAERDRLWPRVWLHAAALDGLASPGDFVAVTLGGVDVLLVRGRDRVLRAFHNVCRHRGRRLVTEPCGRAQALRCPFHAWQWHTDGTLAQLPDRAAFGALADGPDVDLSPLACDTWGGQAWVHLGTPAESLAEWLAPVEAALAHYRLEEYALVEHLTIELACNWKVGADAFNEGYHVHAVHPYMLGAIDDTGVRTELHGPHALQVIPIARPSARRAGQGIDEALAGMLRDVGVDPARLEGDGTRAVEAVRAALRARGGVYAGFDDEELVSVRSWFVFPSLTLNAGTDQLMLHRHRPVPGDPERTWLDQLIFRRIAPGQPRPAAPAPKVWQLGVDRVGPVLEDDARNLIEVQRGLRSPGFHELVLGGQEERVVHLHRLLDRYLGEDSAQRNPET